MRNKVGQGDNTPRLTPEANEYLTSAFYAERQRTERLAGELAGDTRVSLDVAKRAYIAVRSSKYRSDVSARRIRIMDYLGVENAIKITAFSSAILILGVLLLTLILQAAGTNFKDFVQNMGPGVGIASPVILAIVAGCVSLYGTFLSPKSDFRRDRRRAVNGQLLGEWTEIEDQLGRLGSLLLPGEADANRRRPMGSLILELSLQKVISDVVASDLKEIVSARNSIVHEDGPVDVEQTRARLRRTSKELGRLLATTSSTSD